MSTTGWARSTGRASVPGGGVIWTPDQRLRVFVSSRLREQPAERQAVREAVTSLRLVPVMCGELGLTELPARIQDEGEVSYRHFSAAAELRQLVADDLEVLLSERFAAGPAARAVPRRGGGRCPRPLPVAITLLVGRERSTPADWRGPCALPPQRR
jgi:hypothetical protein